MIVRVYHVESSQADLIGWLHLVDGQVQAWPAPLRDQRLLDGLLVEEIGWFRTGKRTVPITAQSHPREFLENLHLNFHGSYFWCSRAAEAMLPSSPTRLRAIWSYLTRDEQRWLLNLVQAWGEPKVLAQWESLRVQIAWVRNL